MIRYFFLFLVVFFSGCIFTPPPSYREVYSSDSRLLEIARSYIGTPYRYGGMSESGFDCSGFVCHVYKSVGVKLPRTSKAQSQSVHKIGREELMPGDLLFFDTSGRGEINHSGIYLGDGRFIHSSSGKRRGVVISDLNSAFYSKAFRWGGRVVE
jgi:cell wall-associated NlpC family hydrolase